MKKPSTAALRRRGKLQGEQLTVGLDLGDCNRRYWTSASVVSRPFAEAVCASQVMWIRINKSARTTQTRENRWWPNRSM